MTVLLAQNSQRPSVICCFVLLGRHAALQAERQPHGSKQLKWAKITDFLVGGKLRY